MQDPGLSAHGQGLELMLAQEQAQGLRPVLIEPEEQPQAVAAGLQPAASTCARARSAAWISAVGLMCVPPSREPAAKHAHAAILLLTTDSVSIGRATAA